MLNIARRQLMSGLQDAKYIFLAVLILIAFLYNGIIFSESYRHEMEDYRLSESETSRLMQSVCSNLQTLAISHQRVVKPPSPLAFVAEGGSRFMPNVVTLNAFSRWGEEFQHRTDERIPILPALDWSFIIGMLMTLLAIMVSYSAVAGEKKSGTLRLVLSNPVSKLKLLAGKFIGLLMVMMICLFVGVMLNLASIVLLEGPPLTAGILWPLMWAITLSVLCISAFILAGLAVSSMTRSPAVALVVLLVIWVMAVFVVPGIGRLIAEQIVEVPSQSTVSDEAEMAAQAVDDAAPINANYWNGDPFAANIPDRARLKIEQLSVVRKIFDDYLESQIRQSLAVKTLSSFSPQGLLSDALQSVCGTGIYGFRHLYRNSKIYRRNLYQFIANRDKADPTTPHLVYGTYSHFDPGVFSQKPVPFEDVPRFSSLWSDTGLSLHSDWPMWQLVFMIVFNLAAGIVALITLLRYDPR